VTIWPAGTPTNLEVDTSGDKPALKPKEGGDDSDLPDFSKDLGTREPVSSLDEETAEQVLLPAARRRMAMDRQQLLDHDWCSWGSIASS